MNECLPIKSFHSPYSKYLVYLTASRYNPKYMQCIEYKYSTLHRPAPALHSHRIINPTEIASSGLILPPFCSSLTDSLPVASSKSLISISFYIHIHLYYHSFTHQTPSTRTFRHHYTHTRFHPGGYINNLHSRHSSTTLASIIRSSRSSALRPPPRITPLTRRLLLAKISYPPPRLPSSASIQSSPRRSFQTSPVKMTSTEKGVHNILT